MSTYCPWFNVVTDQLVPIGRQCTYSGFWIQSVLILGHGSSILISCFQILQIMFLDPPLELEYVPIEQVLQEEEPVCKCRL